MSSQKTELRLATSLVKGGTSPAFEGGRAVNPPVVRASTVLFDSMDDMNDARRRRGTERMFTYGARGNPTGFALEDVVAQLEGGYRTRLFPTGLAAISMVFLAFARPGDHVLIADCVYQPLRHFVDTFLRPWGVEVTYFRADGTDVAQQLKPTTRLVYVECPGSLVYEMCDLPALAEIAHRHGALVVADNTWGSGLQYRPLALGADVSIMAATKYLSGHSDVMMGTVTTTQACWQTLATMCDAQGVAVSPDDAYLVLRGTRTLAARLAMHERHALEIARWLAARPDVARVFCPALPDDPGHTLWQRDCTGTNGLVSFEFARADLQAAAGFVNALTLFGIGASWGGFESLATVSNVAGTRTCTDWSAAGPIVRLHIGLEDPQDLIDDLAQAFARIQA
ncbi:cystathionine beta-lyase [Ralstonia flatus]|uniref:Cystathionine beta-lyase n=1 Tax=Ralstonia flatus TaxID=3058601 RepID=A0AAD2F4Z6_9RALS|nr:cystathionine beta-lyase [Ralstonia sp. LMG 32965]MBN6211244.1 cystathionine beta-lyase [Ralstonia pickettii]CAJ0860073.1 Cystathionine beta-lyase [Ralstonia sp. LMG 32965]CAJ0868119.1 Cystathionine beta-lyase [Ralstonia sp. LMG 32965]